MGFIDHSRLQISKTQMSKYKENFKMIQLKTSAGRTTGAQGNQALSI